VVGEADIVSDATLDEDCVGDCEVDVEVEGDVDGVGVDAARLSAASPPQAPASSIVTAAAHTV
jgi:hypothetical protein